MWFRGEGEKRYLFNFTNDGRCGFYDYDNGTYKPFGLVQDQKAAKVKLDAVKAGAENWVVLRAFGDQLDIWINGKNVYSYSRVLTARSKGTIGLYVSGGNAVEFDIRAEKM